MQILALSGSLRAASRNTALLGAGALLAPPGLTLSLFDGLAALPPFNPDLEAADPPPVARLRAALIAADAVLIASPEYAHGVSGVLKNALDWMVGNESFVHKPVALWNASPRATHALAALRETLVTMSARLVEPACIAVPLLGTRLDAPTLAADPTVSAQLRAALEALQRGPEREAQGESEGFGPGLGC
jgi:chromate reductase